MDRIVKACRAILCLPMTFSLVFLGSVLVKEDVPWFVSGIAYFGAVLAGLRWTI